MRKDAKQLRTKLRKLGYTVVIARSGHVHVYDGDMFLVSMSCSPSDFHGVSKAVRDLKKKGVPL